MAVIICIFLIQKKKKGKQTVVQFHLVPHMLPLVLNQKGDCKCNRLIQTETNGKQM